MTEDLQMQMSDKCMSAVAMYSPTLFESTIFGITKIHTAVTNLAYCKVKSHTVPKD